MLSNDPYAGVPAVRALHRAGELDAALAELDDSGEKRPELRAELLIDRFFWQGRDLEDAQAAVDAVDPASTTGQYLAARLAYARILFDQAQPGDEQLAEAGFQAIAADPARAGWGEFHLGVFSDNVRQEPDKAQAHYERAARHAEADSLLESYVVRQQSVHATGQDEKIRLLRRSLYLRATLGWRPQTAAAMAALADELPDGPERELLREATRLTAEQLRIPWLIGSLGD
jgi:hypothetical protein